MGKKKRRDRGERIPQPGEPERASGVQASPASADAPAKIIALPRPASRDEDNSREVEVGTGAEINPVGPGQLEQEEQEDGGTEDERSEVAVAAEGNLLPADPFVDSFLVRSKSRSTTVALAVLGAVLVAVAGLYSYRALSGPPQRPRGIEPQARADRSGALVSVPPEKPTASPAPFAEREHSGQEQPTAGPVESTEGVHEPSADRPAPAPPRAVNRAPSVEPDTPAHQPNALSSSPAMDSNDYGALLSRGHDRWHRSRICQSQADYERAIAANPRGDAAMSALALCYLNMGRQDDSLSMATRATDVNPNNAEAWLVRGYVLATRRDRDRAREAYQRCIDAKARQHSPECVRALRQLR